jgi:hypothetical protein
MNLSPTGPGGSAAQDVELNTIAHDSGLSLNVGGGTFFMQQFYYFYYFEKIDLYPKEIRCKNHTFPYVTLLIRNNNIK